MKKISLLCIASCCAFIVCGQTLFTYGNNAVDSREFLRAYNRNKTPGVDKESSIREYLDLYVKFKLKVKAAADLRMDTLPQIVADVRSFRTQVEENYMSDENARTQLLQEAITRSAKDIHVYYFSVPVDPADTTRAYATMKALQNALKGSNDYVKVAEDISSKHIPVKVSNLGYITAFSLPYNFENVIYGLRPGQVSEPMRTKSSLHLFKAINERKNIGNWKVAQILFLTPPSTTKEEMDRSMRKADSVYNLLVKGADFAEMAKSVSEDRLTYMLGGEMAEFSTGKYNDQFESAVIRLNKDGEISRPFATSFGIHIVKRLAHTPFPANTDDPQFVSDVRQKFQQDGRASLLKEQFVKSIVKKVGFKRTAVTDAELLRYADTILSKYEGSISDLPVSKKTIAKFTKGSVTGADWLQYVKEYSEDYDLYKDEKSSQLLNMYWDYAAKKYYKEHLEEYNEEFAYQMKEFLEGNMLFEIMEQKVWGYSINDTIGLKKLYDQQSKNYVWPQSASMIIINAANETFANETIQLLNNGRDWREIADAMEGSIQADSGRYEMSQIPNTTAGDLKEGTILPQVNNSDGTVSIIKIIKILPAGSIRTFEEARGLVTNDYQKLLEDQWLSDLTKKYPVKINQKVVAEIIK